MRSKLVKAGLITGLAAGVTALAVVLALEVTAVEVTALNKNRPGALVPRQSLTRYTRDNVIRLHVIANSDSEYDQAMKLAVRDSIVARMGPVFAGAPNQAAASMMVNARLDEVRALAQDEVKAWGADYTVRVVMGFYDFPVRTYGDLTLPAGNYLAVRVLIGQAKGRNWWCVLFPPLCFVDASKAGVVSGPTELVPPVRQEVRVRFKLLEVLGLSAQ